MIIPIIIGLLIYSVEPIGTPKSDRPREPRSGQQKLKSHAKGSSQSDYWSGLTANDLWAKYGDDWAGSSTLPDGSHNPNEIKGWGSASASAWTQTEHKPEKPDTQQQPQQMQQQIPMAQQQPVTGTGYGYGYSGGYSGGYQQQQPSTGYGYSGGGYTGSTGYGTGGGYSSSGFGYSGGYSGGYNGGYQQPSTGTGYGYSSGDTGYGYQQQPSTGYDQGYGAPSTGYGDTGYSSSGFGYDAPTTGSTGQMPGGKQPIGAPGGTMGAPGGAAGGTMGAPGATMGAPGAKKPLPGGAQGAAGMGMGAAGAVNGKCPLPHRHRKPWNLLTMEQKDMFIDGFQQIRKNGKLDVIAQTHAQHDIQNYVHYTSLFSFYHAYLVWEVETAIRDLGGKFACFTMPYYDFTLDAGLEDDPTILHSGIGGDGDKDNSLCVMDDETGFSWQTCKDYTPWRTVEDAPTDSTQNQQGIEGIQDGMDEDKDDKDEKDNKGTPIRDEKDGAILYSGYDDDDIIKPHYISYGEAYDDFVQPDDPDYVPPEEEGEDDKDVKFEGDDVAKEELETESVEEQCFWTQANCRSSETSPFCCLKRKKSTTTLLPTAAEIGDAMYRSKNIKEWQGYLNMYYNKVTALFGTDYYAHMANGYATEDPIFWLTQSFITNLRMLWQDCWNYNNIPKDKLDMHYNSYHPYCGTFDAIPDSCKSYNLALDAPMNFYELQKSEWSLAYHKIVTVRKMWSPEYWNVIYELGPFYTTSGVNNWCDNTKDSDWFIETMDYNVDSVNTPINRFSQQLREQMIKDNVEQSGIFKTVSSLSCQYNRKYSSQSCWTEDLIETELQIETCDDEEVSVSANNQTLDELLEMEGIGENQCLKRIRRENFAYSEHALQVKKQLCKGDWDYKCPEYNTLLYGQYASSLDNPVEKQFKKHTSFFAKSGWIWMIVINGILVIIVAIGCGIWHCSRSKTVKIPLLNGNGDIDDDDDDDDDNNNTYGTIQTSQEIEEYQPLLV